MAVVDGGNSWRFAYDLVPTSSSNAGRELIQSISNCVDRHPESRAVPHGARR
jgi:hypothetical protein